MSDANSEHGSYGGTPSAPAGWYLDPATGVQRWWDGTAWGPQAPGQGDHLPPSQGVRDEERTWSMWSHLGPLLVLVGGMVLSAGALSIFAFVFPLVVMNTIGNRSAQVRAHAVESLNFQLSMLVYSVGLLVVSIVVGLLTLGFGLLVIVPVIIALAIFELVVMVLASVQASNGGFYRYPITIRFVS
ncbi:MAG TPA: DUF4870 domain-containing protein [Nocardioidaceae bacterium]|nr:DUF4870 domain-containing protein [Nocardioidaceae bacterium]